MWELVDSVNIKAEAAAVFMFSPLLRATVESALINWMSMKNRLNELAYSTSHVNKHIMDLLILISHSMN